uniref:Uncharacterized protein n=1 Tax=Chromera velia CCMP2878 TaxID=1169474 RepID=A0A0G4FCB4_9ALVE|eukprot:Cvel_3053.t1-p1 / transcript=Cvel_3053.t1 / gene=Cvel_3053 / organism=Chromera_velia_CCMP2878 / gene_product=hypothetical protein / transcript_product=hypothetical protein / location=Cvel_scaffold122:13501-19465(+) / protein_length=350 / sequence_SO=supercontig / SO=protein_coding / is_pseudo=false
MSDAELLSKRPGASPSRTAAAASDGHTKPSKVNLVKSNQHKEDGVVVKTLSRKKEQKPTPQPDVSFPVEDSLLSDGNLQQQQGHGRIPKELVVRSLGELLGFVCGSRTEGDALHKHRPEGSLLHFADREFGRIFLSGMRPAMKKMKLIKRNIRLVVTCNRDRNNGKAVKQTTTLERLGIRQERLQLCDDSAQWLDFWGSLAGPMARIDETLQKAYLMEYQEMSLDKASKLIRKQSENTGVRTETTPTSKLWITSGRGSSTRCPLKQPLKPSDKEMTIMGSVTSHSNTRLQVSRKKYETTGGNASKWKQKKAAKLKEEKERQHVAKKIRKVPKMSESEKKKIKGARQSGTS